MKSFRRPSGVATAVALLIFGLEAGARAQSIDDRSGVAVREVSIASGFGAVQLPPITLGGFLPNDILRADLVTSGTALIDGRRVTPRTHYRFELFGAYTGRVKYSQLNAPTASVTAGVSRAIGHKWQLGAGGASAIVSSDHATFGNNTRQIVDDAASFDDFVRTAALTRSPHPDPAAAALFVPISQTLVGSDLSVNRVAASSVQADVSYTHSPRLATYFHGEYTTVRPISSNADPAVLRLSQDSSAEAAGVRLIYSSSERIRLTTAVDYSQVAGGFTHKGVSMSLGYGWSGRKWFTEAHVGALVPFETEAESVPSKTIANRSLGITYRAGLGYKFRTQTLLVQYERAPHDEYGNGGRNTATGFEGDVRTLVGAWSWSAPSSRWLARSDFSMIQRPGNFSNIYAWLATAGIGRQLGPSVRLMGEFLFDRHGSRGFEGYHLARQGVRLNLTWNPTRRRVAASNSDQ
jgi:hypothetical protein